MTEKDEINSINPIKSFVKWKIKRLTECKTFVLILREIKMNWIIKQIIIWAIKTYEQFND